MSKYFIAYIIVGAVFGVISLFVRRAKEKALKEHLQHLEDTINKNATACNKQFTKTDALILLSIQKDALFEQKINYLIKRIEAHKKNPKHYPLQPAQWLAAFELANSYN
ncbi:MAG: hypothetical protein GY810_05565 [Aureispira sp.]|nr:hypothetical protein [Aureispira sp.]